MQIAPLHPADWNEAAALVARRVATLRRQMPILPKQYESVETIYPLLADLAGRAPGAAARRNGRLVGFLTAMSLPSIKGVRGTFSPEWAHAAVREAGCVRIATDFESANISGAAFWMRHFGLLAYCVIRYVDERTVFAHAGRRAEDFW